MRFLNRSCQQSVFICVHKQHKFKLINIISLAILVNTFDIKNYEYNIPMYLALNFVFPSLGVVCKSFIFCLISSKYKNLESNAYMRSPMTLKKDNQRYVSYCNILWSIRDLYIKHFDTSDADLSFILGSNN